MIGALLTFYTPQVCCLILALLYPVYKTLHTMETRESHAVTQWFAYWVIFGLVTGIEGVLGGVLRWIPVYYIGKALGVLWLVAPHTEGAYWVWTQTRPKIMQYAPQLLRKGSFQRRTMSPATKSDDGSAGRAKHT